MARSYVLDMGNGPRPSISYEAELNPEQLEAVTSKPGPALVIAGAGSGKTRTLTYRVAWLLEHGVAAREILLLTFTNKAAREMLDRVSHLLPGAAEGIWGGTFHSIGNRILRRHAERIGFRQGFSIMDRQDQEDLLDAVIAQSGFVSKERMFPKANVLGDLYSLSINTGEPLGTVIARRSRHFIPLTAEIEKVQVLYEARKKDANSMDFDDLLSKVLELFQTCGDVAAIYQKQFRHVLVDEYQDTNRIQAELIDTLARDHRQVMVVGDDAQSIYSWRGANFENILAFPRRYEGAKVYRITTNYRSVPQILDVANAAIAGNERQFKKDLHSVRKAGPMRPALVALGTNTHQAAFVAQRILELHEEGADLQDMAVLYRAHFHSLEIQLELTRRGIPFELTSGLRFFEQAHVKDIAAYLKFVANPRDETAFKRMVRLLPGVGPKAAETLWRDARAVLADPPDFHLLHQACKPPAKARKYWEQLVHTLEEIAPEGKPTAPSGMLQSVFDAVYDDYLQGKYPNYESRREDLLTLISYARQFSDVEEFLSQLALMSGVETGAELGPMADESQKVTLSSIHQAKGLEWKYVFLIWMAEGMFPSARSIEDPEGLEEERRLFYVAVTRSMDELYLTWPEMRLNSSYGDAFQRASRFLGEIPEELLETWDVQTGIRGEWPESPADVAPF